MSDAGAQDRVFAGLLSEAGAVSDTASRWSNFIAPGLGPDATLRSAHSPTFTLPEITPRNVAALGQEYPDADYCLVGRLGEGGMGVVFEAKQKHLERVVALKMIRPERTGDQAAQCNFLYEAIITAGLEHPGIVPVLEFGRSQDGRVFYTMKKAPGLPWSRVIRDKPLADNLEIFNRVADVVAYAHANGVIHRDLKPGNVLLGEFGEVWVSDWGVAVRCNAAGDYSHACPGGTPQYMPPEMAKWEANRQGPATDVYLLGGILHEILTGRPPHAGSTPLAALAGATANQIQFDRKTNSLFGAAKTTLSALPEWRFGDVPSLQRAIKRCLAENESGNRLQGADSKLAEAVGRGSYDLYQSALAEYDAAIAANPDSPDARRGKDKALLAYSRQALGNNEFYLARSIILAETNRNAEAMELAKSIFLAQNKARRRPWRWRLANTVLGIFVFMAVIGGWYLFWNWPAIVYNTSRSRQRNDSYYYQEIKKGLSTLTGNLSAMGHNAKVQKQAAIQNKVRAVTALLEDCEKRMVNPEGATPYTIKQSCEYLYGKISEVDAELKEITALCEQSPDDRLERNMKTVNVYYSKMLEPLNAYRVNESK